MATVKRISSRGCGRGTQSEGKQGFVAQGALTRRGRLGRSRLRFGLTLVAALATVNQCYAQTRPTFVQYPTLTQESSPSSVSQLEQDPANSAALQQRADALIQRAEALQSGRSASDLGGSVSTQPPTAASPSQQSGSGPSSSTSNTNATGSDSNAAESLKLEDVIASLYRSFPVIQQATLERSRTSGQITGAYGAYDTNLQGYSLSEAVGFYRNYRHGIGVARQTWWGTYLSAGYRIGRGEFAPWYKERETNEAGEFSLGAGIPLLQGRAIDPQRVAVFQASLSRQAAEPTIQQAILDNSLQATAAYWDWISAGAVWRAQKELAALAEERGKQLEVGVKAELFAEIDLIFNRQLIAERRAKAIESEQKFRSTAFKLSLFLRDENGQPMIPDDRWLPEYFPEITPIPPGDYQKDLAAALSRRPEPMLIRLEIQQIQLDRQLANNYLLPRLDFITEAAQDTGTPASASNDKGQFELMLGVQGEVPIQRRAARGKIQETTAKIAQLNEKLRLQQDKIGIELQTAYNALVLAVQVIEQSELALRTAVDALARFQFGFQRGKVNLIDINLLESKVTETEIKLVEAERTSLVALAAMQAALGLDPLDQAMLVSALPASKRPGPGHLPEVTPPTKEQFDKDWQLRLDATSPPRPDRP